jgi:hypothetical protein
VSDRVLEKARKKIGKKEIREELKIVTVKR